MHWYYPLTIGSIETSGSNAFKAWSGWHPALNFESQWNQWSAVNLHQLRIWAQLFIWTASQTIRTSAEVDILSVSETYSVFLPSLLHFLLRFLYKGEVCVMRCHTDSILTLHSPYTEVSINTRQKARVIYMHVPSWYSACPLPEWKSNVKNDPFHLFQVCTNLLWTSDMRNNIRYEEYQNKQARNGMNTESVY